MAEGGFDPDEIITVNPNNTTDETIDFVTPSASTSTSGGFNTGTTTSTPIKNTDGKQRNELKLNKIKNLYKHLGVQEDIRLVDPDKFEIKRNTKLRITDLFYDKDGDWVQLTNKNDGRLLFESTMKDRFCGCEAMKNNLGIIKKITLEQAAELNRVNNNLPSTSDIDNANDIELVNIVNSIQNSKEDLIHVVREIDVENVLGSGYTWREVISQLEESTTTFSHIKTLATKMATINDQIKERQDKIDYIQNSTEYNEEEKQHRIKQIKDTIKEYKEIRDGYQENINNFKYTLKDQVTLIRSTISKALDSDMTLGEKIKTLFREQGITIFSILTAFGMAIGVLVEALLPSGGVGSTTAPSNTTGGGGDYKTNAKEWIKNKLQALASLLGKLSSKTGEALLEILGSIIG